jgi:branched-chain amino acid transport system substrate-binding protein
MRDGLPILRGLAIAACLLAFADPAQAEMDIAIAGPMTGPLASYGEQMKNGAELAIKNINKAGGVLGEDLVLKVGDDQCDPKQAVSVANQMSIAGVPFVAGHLCSGSSMPASEVYAEEGVLMISPASTTPDLTDRGLSNVFRTAGRDDQQGATAADFIAENFPDARIAIIHDKSTYAKGLADVVRADLHAKGIEEVMYDAINAGEKDYSALVSRMQRDNVTFLFCGCHHTEAALIVRQMRDKNYMATVMGGDAFTNDEFWSITGNAGNGVLFTFNPDPQRNSDAAPIVAQFKETGITPSGFTLYTYAAVQVFAQAANKAGSTDVDKLSETIKTSNFDTVLGRITFNEKGDVSAPGFVVYEWADGKYDYFKPAMN